MWRSRNDFVRALLATICLVACFAITILSWPEKARSRLAVTGRAPVAVVRAPIVYGAEIMSAAHAQRETR